MVHVVQEKRIIMNILITGHSGFIGSHTAEYFMEQGHIVYGVARSLGPCNHHNTIWTLPITTHYQD